MRICRHQVAPLHVVLVEEQAKQDTEFSTVKVPNPEYKETLSMGIALANKIDADVVFGTDPDCDRLGVAIRNGEGEYIIDQLPKPNELVENNATIMLMLGDK